jgi:hypothetical protein
MEYKTGDWATGSTGLAAITMDDLLPADVLIFDIPGTFGQIVSSFDGEHCNHATLYLGNNQVAEAVPEGVTRNPLNQGAWRSREVLVRRYGVPVDVLPVLERAEHYLEIGSRYAYGQLLLCAGICLLRQSGATDPFAKMIETWVMSQAAKFVQSLQDHDKKPMICSELVYRCYEEADPVLPIQVDLFRGKYAGGPEGRARILASLNKLSPMFVSPGDLKISPSLRTVGLLTLDL